MESRLLSTPKLKSALTELMSQAFDLGYIPSVTNTKSTKLCLIISNEDSGKCALLGTMVDKQGESVVEACMVSVRNWLWAADEGFTRDEIVDNPHVCRKIFKRVPVDLLARLLS